MKIAMSLLAGALALAAGPALADTTSRSEKQKMESGASPSNPVKQDEERTQAHSQPDVPYSTGGSSQKQKAKTPKKARKSEKASSSAGATAPAQRDPARDLAFKSFDIDGDGMVSKAEAAGHAELVEGFDRADRNHDGKLSRAEYDQLGKKRGSTKRQAAR